MADLHATFTVGVKLALRGHRRPNTPMRNVTDNVKICFVLAVVTAPSRWGTLTSGETEKKGRRRRRRRRIDIVAVIITSRI